MKDKDLQNIKRKYDDLVCFREQMKLDVARKKELEQTEEVKEYLRLSKTINEYDMELITRIDAMDERELLEYAIYCSNRIKETNHIYVYMGTFQELNHLGMNKPSIQRHYMDIEQDGLGACIPIPIEACETFETENIVLYPDDTGMASFYETIRYQFFKDAMEQGQEVALQKIKAMRHLPK